MAESNIFDELLGGGEDHKKDLVKAMLAEFAKEAPVDEVRAILEGGGIEAGGVADRIAQARIAWAMAILLRAGVVRKTETKKE